MNDSDIVALWGQQWNVNKKQPNIYYETKASHNMVEDFFIKEKINNHKSAYDILIEHIKSILKK